MVGGLVYHEVELLAVKLPGHHLVGCHCEFVCSHHLLDTIGECQFVLLADGSFCHIVNPCEKSTGDDCHCHEHHHHIQ